MSTQFLITGSNGVLGTKLIEAMLARGDSFVASDRSDCLNSYLGDFRYQSLDITDAKQIASLMRHYAPAIILHAAAFTAVDRAEVEHDTCWQVNVEGTRLLAEAASLLGSKLVYLSTDYVFDGKSGPYLETATPNPLGRYAKSKFAGEKVVQTLLPNALICRTTILYGIAPHFRPTFVSWLLNELRAQREVKIVVDQWSNPTLAEDLAGMILSLLDHEAEGVYNAMGTEYLSRFDFAKQISRFFGLDERLIQPTTTAALDQLAPRPLHGGGIIDKLVALTGYQPMSVIQQLQRVSRQL